MGEMHMEFSLDSVRRLREKPKYRSESGRGGSQCKAIWRLALIHVKTIVGGLDKMQGAAFLLASYKG
jgi:hypothetical protein